MTSSKPKIKKNQRKDFDSIASLFNPKTVALFGISRRDTSLGKTIFEKLIATGFRGEVYPIHPQMQTVDGHEVWASLAAVAKPVDLAVVVLPKAHVFDVLKSCGEHGVKNVVLISAGFSEVGNFSDEVKLCGLAQQYGFNLIGPNCMGVINTDPQTILNATFSPVFPPQGRIGVISQSGSLAQVLLEYCDTLGVGISKFISVGNQAHTAEWRLLEYFSHDPQTQCIMLYLEKISDAKKFVSVGRRCKKPMVVLLGCSDAKQKRKLQQISRRAGAIVVESLSEWFGVASVLDLQPRPKGRRLGILTNAGGPGMLAAQTAVAKNLKLPKWRPSLVRNLRRFLPAEAILQNPLDILATATALDYEKTLRLLLGESQIDRVLIIFVTPAQRDAALVAQSILRVIASVESKKAVVCCFLMGKGRGRLLEAFGATRLPIFSFPEEAVSALSAIS